MSLTTNEYALKITGTAYLSEKLELSHDILVKVEANVVKAEASDNQNGSMDITYKCKLITAEVENDKGKKIKSVSSKRWSTSQKIRWNTERIRNDKDIQIPEEDYYTMVGSAIIANLEEIINEYVKI